MDDNKNSAKISPSGMRQTLGIDTTRYADKARRSTELPLFLDRYGRFETKRILSSIATPTPNRQTLDINGNTSGIISYLQPKHIESGSKTARLKRLKAMAPEIQQAQVLVASSIMSPNDLQEGDFTFAFPNVDAVEADSDLYDKLAKLYDDYFNRNMDMGSRCYEWICESMYASGAKAVLILPPGLHERIANRTREDLKNETISSKIPIGGMESFDHFISGLSNNDNFMLSRRPTTWAAVLGTDSESDLRDIVPAMEQLDLRVPDRFNPGEGVNLESFHVSDKEYSAGLEDMIVNMRTKLAKGDLIRISENPEIVRFNLRKNINARNKIDSALDSKYAPKEYLDEAVVSLDDTNIPLPEGSRPTLIELPTEAVIPICIPGAPSEHLGYFIMIDEQGQPLAYSDAKNPDPNKFFNGSWGNNDNTSESFAATYGTSSNVLRIFGNPKAATDTGNAIFNHFLDKFLRQHLKGLIPDENVELGRFNSVATAMFYRLLANKRTTLVYAPPRLLHYLAYDYRDDGTGMPKPENIEFILSLRTTLMVSNILAQANDAINHKKIEFDGGENIKNIEQIMDLIKRVFITKNKISGSIDPSEIMDDIASNAITIVPKNLPGLGGNFNVDIQTAGSQSIRADDNLLESLSNLLISNLDVPPSALNQLSEPEFSRSLVTYNLFFAKKINLYQKITCRFMTELIRDFTRYDSVFQKALSMRLNTITKKPLKKKMPAKVADLASENKNTYSSMTSMAKACLEGVSVSLPKSNIVADKTLYEEVRNFISNLEEISQQLFNNERVPSDDQEATNALTIVRSRWKYDQLKNYLARIGKMSMVDIPDIDDLASAEDYTDYIQTLRNINAAITKHGAALTAAGEEEGGFSSDSSSSSGGSDDFGGGDDEGGDDDLGGMDDFSEDEGGDEGESDEGGDENEEEKGDDEQSEI